MANGTVNGSGGMRMEGRDSAHLIAGKYMYINKHWYPDGKVKKIEYMRPGGDCDSVCCNEHEITYDTTGRIISDLNFNQGKFDSAQILYYYKADANAMFKKYMGYKNGIETGKRIEWYGNNKRVEGQYVGGKEEGTWRYYKNNKEYAENIFKNGKAVNLKEIDTISIEKSNH